MPAIDYTEREVRLRYGIAGPPGSGKTTIFHRLHGNLPPSERADILVLPLGTHRLLSFDFVPGELLPLAAYRARATLSCFTGSLTETTDCARVFADLDAVLFVADSRRGQMSENVAALMRLGAMRFLREVPVLFFYNKRDVPDAASVVELEAQLNPLRALHRSGVATTGDGIDGLLHELTRATVATSA